jgi:hypothetical protein
MGRGGGCLNRGEINYVTLGEVTNCIVIVGHSDILCWFKKPFVLVVQWCNPLAPTHYAENASFQVEVMTFNELSYAAFM